MDYKYTKQTPVKLREIGKDEKWLLMFKNEKKDHQVLFFC